MPLSVTALMEQLETHIRLHIPDERITTDPRNITPPCVLIEPPRLDFTQAALCGDPVAEFTVMVIGLNGAYAELRTLDVLLTKVLSVPGLNVTLAEPVGFENGPPGVDPNQAYRLTIERMAITS